MSDLRVRGLCLRGLGPFDLDVAAGACVAISGPSGSGKTMLLRALADLDEHSGEVFVDGTECRRLEAPRWRQRVGMLPAESAWWQDTVDGHFVADAAALARVGLPAAAATWAIARLSTGEKQRLAVLRLLGNQPQVLLLDEPTTNLDRASVACVEELLGDYRRSAGAAVVWVTHDASQAARIADRRLSLSNGCLREETQP